MKMRIVDNQKRNQEMEILDTVPEELTIVPLFIRLCEAFHFDMEEINRRLQQHLEKETQDGM